jgi:putative oxidoreductase
MGVVTVLSAQSTLGFALVRILMGLGLVHAGYQKTFVFGMGKVTEVFANNYGIWMPQISAPFISLLELVGGAALTLGLFTRYLGLIFAIEFVVASYTIWLTVGRGFAGARLELFVVAVGLMLATNGAGRFSLDKLLGRGDA